MSKGCSCCADRRNDRKEFRQDHGGGPEEMPHRKKGGRKKHVHNFVNGPKTITYEDEKYYIESYVESCEACGLNRARRDWRYKFSKTWRY